MDRRSRKPNASTSAADPPDQAAGTEARDAEKRRRLAAKLRENLLKRKVQIRGRTVRIDPEPEDEGGA